jgi:hypothetical protein
MSLETLFVVWPNCLLALPTDFATAWTSSLRGTATPRIFFWRVAPLSTIPPATPTAVAPMATAGPLTLLAAPLRVPTTPPLPAPFWLAVVRFDVLRFAVLRLELLLRLGVDLRALDFFALPLLERPGFERDALPDAVAERLRDAPLDFGLEPELLAARLLLFPLLDVDSVAIRFPFRERACCNFAYPTHQRLNRMQGFCLSTAGFG